MKKVEKILVALDGSAPAARALPYAATLARRVGAELLLVRAAMVGPFVQGDLAAAEAVAVARAEADLGTVARALRADGLRVETHVCYGPAASAILEEARVGRADLIVLSTHGRSGVGRWLYGSVADRVLHRAAIPVLVVPPAADGGWPAHGGARVLVPIDGSPLAEEALVPATALAAALDGSLLLVRAVEPLYGGYSYGQTGALLPELAPEERLRTAAAELEELARRLAAEGHRVELRVEVGPPAQTIARVADEYGADAIALATHGRGGLARLVMGSVATGLLQRTDRPILLIRPRAVAEPAPIERAPAEAIGRPAEVGAVGRPAEAGAVGRSAEGGALALTAAERELVGYGLELLLNSADRDPGLTGPIVALLARVESEARGAAALVASRS